ncbi:MAG: phosphopentomutase [candidate division Zixibacteria bacterium SM1_73]|nr:MAG: phosphopentomutase [candidate division Zixibacteria bacterium SM1_73]
MIERVVVIILDACGIGELPDAHLYGDEGSNTIKNTAKAVGGLKLPNLERLGLGNIEQFSGVNPETKALGNYGKMAELSPGKDSTSGHWEIMGVVLKRPFPVYPEGFPAEIIEPFEKTISSRILGNKPASGTEIIKELGEEHLRTHNPIVYTSADSVFQIAAHEEIIPVDRLYEMCIKARNILTGEHGVARVIARPFVGKPGSFKRTERRKDFSLPPPEETVLDILKEQGIPVIGIGKIEDLFGGRGLTESIHTKNNSDGVDKLVRAMKRFEKGLLFINLIDFDMLWGHRNNPQAFASGLEDFDQRLPEVLNLLRSEDLLIITADHGCDPTTPSTDHSREYVPLLVYGKPIRSNINLGIRKSFSDVGKTIAEIFKVSGTKNGESFWSEIKT